METIPGIIVMVNIVKINFRTLEFHFKRSGGFIPHKDLNRGSVEIPFFPDFVFKKSAIRLLHPLRQVTEENKGRDHRIFKHRHIFDFHKFSLIAWRWRLGNLLKHVSVKL